MKDYTTVKVSKEVLKKLNFVKRWYNFIRSDNLILNDIIDIMCTEKVKEIEKIRSQLHPEMIT